MKLCSVLLLGAAACVTPADEPETALGVQELGPQCPSWKCGENSPLIDNYGFHELNLDHLVNNEGFLLDSATKGTHSYTLYPSNGVIAAKDNVNSTWLSGTALVGLTLHVKRGASTYLVQIMEVEPAWFWAKTPGGTYPQLEAYRFDWIDAQGKYQNLCPVTPDPDDTLGLPGNLSVVFEGDRIDAKAKTVYATGQRRWMNIGCAGSTLAKMQLTGHTGAAAAYGFTTTTAERQTMLKMLSADYCGTGTPFTVAGMPLYWADDHGWMKLLGKADLEARWDQNGAKCLMKPRVAVNPTPLATQTFPDIYAAIKAECPLPPQCADGSTNVGPEHLLSANPALP